MSTINSICYHEPTAHLQSFEELVDFWKPVHGLHVGISDSALTLQLDRILETIGPRTLLIERPIPEVMASLQTYFKGSEILFDYDTGRAYLARLAAAIDQMRHHPLVRVVSFGALRDYDYLQEVIAWLAPGVETLDLRALTHMNIQADREYVIDLIRKPHTHWYREQWNTFAKSAPA